MKTAKNFRFSPQTLDRIAWISGRTGKSATDALEMAVEELTHKIYKSQRASLIPDGKGWYDFVVDGLPLISIEQPALSKIGRHAEELLSQEGGGSDLFGLVALAGGVSGGRVRVFKKNISKVFPPHITHPESG